MGAFGPSVPPKKNPIPLFSVLPFFEELHDFGSNKRLHTKTSGHICYIDFRTNRQILDTRANTRGNTDEHTFESAAHLQSSRTNFIDCIKAFFETGRVYSILIGRKSTVKSKKSR